jgi:hypothetical protein
MLLTMHQILEEWAKDCKISPTNLENHNINVPQIHNKYFKGLLYHKDKARVKYGEYKKTERNRWRYYTGKLSKTALDAFGWEPWQENTQKSDVPLYLESDDIVIKSKYEYETHMECVNALEQIIKQINNFNWIIKNQIEILKFKHGQL